MEEDEGDQLEKWTEQIKASKEELELLKTGDRLETVAAIAKLHNAIAQSLYGWAHWLKNPSIMDYLTPEELAETFEVFKKLAIEFIDLDFKMSTSVMEKQKKAIKEKKEKIKTLSEKVKKLEKAPSKYIS